MLFVCINFLFDLRQKRGENTHIVASDLSNVTQYKLKDHCSLLVNGSCCVSSSGDSNYWHRYGYVQQTIKRILWLIRSDFCSSSLVTMATDSVFSSVEDKTHMYNQARSTTSEMDIASSSSSVGESVTQFLLVITSIFAFVANLAMLISFIVYKQAARKTVNIFVCNQTVLDAASAFFAGVNVSLHMSGYLKTKTGVLRTFIMKFVIIDRVYVMVTYSYCRELLRSNDITYTKIVFKMLPMLFTIGGLSLSILQVFLPNTKVNFLFSVYRD